MDEIRIADDAARVYATSGYRAAVNRIVELRKKLANRSYVDPASIAYNYAALGDKDQRPRSSRFCLRPITFPPRRIRTVPIRSFATTIWHRDKKCSEATSLTFGATTTRARASGSSTATVSATSATTERPRWARTRAASASTLPGSPASAQTRNQGLSSGFTYALSPKLLTDFRFGFLRYRLNINAQDYGQTPAIGIPNIFAADTGDPFATGLPDFQIPGQARLSSAGDYLRLGYSSAACRRPCTCASSGDGSGRTWRRSGDRFYGRSSGSCRCARVRRRLLLL